MVISKKLFLPGIGILLLLWGCEITDETDLLFEPKESDKLTETEINVLIYHAQQFIAHSKKVKLLEKNRQLILTTRPKIRIRYSAKKYGRLEFDWRLSKYTVLHLVSYGNLRSNKQNWQLELKMIVESDPVKDDFVKENKEPFPVNKK